MVVRRGVNEDSILPMARFARERGYTLRYIEYMDVGHTNGWDLEEVVPGRRDPRAHRCRAAPRAARSALSGRGRDALALSGRQRRGRRHRLGHAALLWHLHACPTHGRGHAVHLPLRGPRHGPARRRCAGAPTTTTCGPSSAVWAAATRSLLGDPLGGHERAAQGGDVAHRRLIAAPGAAGRVC